MAQSRRREHTSDDFGTFIKNWLQSPRTVGAVAPSSRLLAKLMAKGLRSGVRVVELGAGTGTLTQAILASGVRPEDLYLVEQNEQFVEILARRFPGCPILPVDATTLASHLGTAVGTFDFVISGLPLLLFTPESKLELFSQAFAALRPGGTMHQFTYGGRCPIDREARTKLGLTRQLIGFTPFNLPPAFVYRFERIAQEKGA